MGEYFPLSLNGEIDKKGHPVFRKKDQVNPDFVFHIPGKPKNTIVVEVKGTLRSKKGIIKDFFTLLNFVRRYEYKAGVFVLYNHSIGSLESLLERRLCRLASFPEAERIHIVAIPTPSTRCERVVLSTFRV
jgi:hypothetical protein